MSNRLGLSILVTISVALFGCGITKEVIVGTGTLSAQRNAAVLAAAEGNSAAMDQIFSAELKSRGFKDVRPAPSGTKKAEGVDVVVEYVDVWRWDLVMYLESISVRLYDPLTGGLIAVARWAHKDQVFHSYVKPEDVVSEVFTDLFAKVKRP